MGFMGGSQIFAGPRPGRVMGPCAAMGAAAAHALDLADGMSVHDVDLDQLSDRLAVNLGER